MVSSVLVDSVCGLCDGFYGDGVFGFCVMEFV
jgi:hypothetical protein